MENRQPPAPTNPQLPVAAEAEWTTAEGLHITTRFAIHAVRRLQLATVVDWSVTPLRAPGYAFGDDLPSWVDLGLSRSSEGDVNMFLIDPTGDKVYRTLSHQSRRLFNRCLCTPLWLAQQNLRIGETRMLQATFPPLPDGARLHRCGPDQPDTVRAHSGDADWTGSDRAAADGSGATAERCATEPRAASVPQSPGAGPRPKHHD